MKVIQKYFLKEYLKLFCLCLFIFLSIYLIIDFLQKIDNFVESEVPMSTIITYFLLKIPHVTIQMIPVGSLISVIIMFSLLQRKNEITAFKTCGLDIFRLSGIMVFITLGIGFVAFLFQEIVVPYASSRSNEIWNLEVEKSDPGHFYGGDEIWYKSDNAIYWIRHFDGTRNILENPTFFFFDKDFQLIKRVDAKKGVWQNNTWKMIDGIIQERENDKDYGLSKFDEWIIKIPETPDTFKKGIKKPEDMSYQQLRSYSETVFREGYDNTKYIVDMNMKLAHPLISVILTFIGIPIALNLKKGGTPLAVSIGVGICFIFIVTMGISRSFGLAGILPPIVAAWVANLIFFLLGIFLMLRIER
ncbi:MAG: LPS export ABC transporter permease LptG [Deltaproteobacteria bacterium]|nr:LPS export ABC transporter permease LptG [Deltaproteobacteria bacterium]